LHPGLTCFDPVAPDRLRSPGGSPGPDRLARIAWPGSPGPDRLGPSRSPQRWSRGHLTGYASPGTHPPGTSPGTPPLARSP